MQKNITKFKSGAIRDSLDGKEDYVETVSFTALKRFAQYMTGKKSKYGVGNFKKGIDISSYEGSLMRHVQKYFENKYEQGIVEVNEDHLAAIVFNVFGIMHEEERVKKVRWSGRVFRHCLPLPISAFHKGRYHCNYHELIKL